MRLAFQYFRDITEWKRFSSCFRRITRTRTQCSQPSVRMNSTLAAVVLGALAKSDAVGFFTEAARGERASERFSE